MILPYNQSRKPCRKQMEDDTIITRHHQPTHVSEGWTRSTQSVPSSPLSQPRSRDRDGGAIVEEEEEEDDNQSGRASWGRSSTAGSPPEEGPLDINRLRLDSEWRSFLSHLNHSMLRFEIANCIPSMVAIIWRDDFCRLAHHQHDLSGWPPADLTPEDEHAAWKTGRLLHSILDRTRITGATMLLALFFVHRYRETTPPAPIGRPGSQFRLFLVGMVLAHKYTEDHPYANRVWAELAGMHVIHINCMEREFLHQINHRLGVKLPDFQRWVIALDRRFQWTAAVREHYIMPALASNYRLMPLPPPPPRRLYTDSAPQDIDQPRLEAPPVAKTRDRDPWPRQTDTRAASRRESVQGPKFSL